LTHCAEAIVDIVSIINNATNAVVNLRQAGFSNEFVYGV